MGAPGLGHRRRAARRRPRHGDRPRWRAAGRADRAVARRPRRRAGARGERRRPGDRAARAGGKRGGQRLPRRAARPRAAPARRPGRAVVRPRRRGRGLAGIQLRARRAAGGRRAGRPARGRRPAVVGAGRRGHTRLAAPRRRGRAARAAGRAAPRLPRRPGLGARLRGQGGRVHPDHRRRGQAVLGLPRLRRAQAAAGNGARARRRDHAHPDGRGGPGPGDLQQVLRRRHGPARGGRPRHRGPPRHVRAGLPGQVLRGHGLPRPHQLHGQLQRPGHAVRDRRAQGLGGAQLLLQHGLGPRQPADHGRALVAAGGLRADAGDDRPRMRLVSLPRRHRSGQRLGGHRRPRSRLLAREPLLEGDRPPRDPGGRACADQGDGLSPAHERAHRRASSSTAATGCPSATTTTARSTSTGPVARRPP